MSAISSVPSLSVFSPAAAFSILNPVAAVGVVPAENFVDSITNNASGVLPAVLNSTQQNGASLLGTLNASTFGQFLTNNPLPDGTPWGNATTFNTNPYTSPPNTGVIRHYDFQIARAELAPDGFLRDVLVINGAYPGPTIEANWGDIIEVTVHNNITDPPEGTAVHWHGLTQKKTPWYDGVPSVQQCPIAPGKSFTYQFQADLYGTSWYHSHYSAQYSAGLHGAMIIHGPNDPQTPYDIDLGPVFISDWYHDDYFTIVEEVMSTNQSQVIPSSLNNLINGKGDFNCSLAPSNATCHNDAGFSKFKFTAGKTHRLRLINAGAEAIQKVSIDDHTMTIIANDFVPIEPYNTTVVTLGVGQRTDVLVYAHEKPTDAVWLRSTITNCSAATQPFGLAVIYYNEANHSLKPNSTAWPVDRGLCQNDDLSLTEPLYSITPPAIPATTEVINITLAQNTSGNTLWLMNNQTFRADYNDPVLLLAEEKNYTYPYDPEWNVYNFGSNSSMRIVVNNGLPVAHPMHIHGHNMYVLEVGNGTWSGTTNTVRPKNPQRRDTQLLPSLGYMVMQIDADNPGVWPFHCHIAWHVSGGLYINVMELPKQINELQIPQVMSQTCTDWDAFTNHNVPDQIDSGL